MLKDALSAINQTVINTKQPTATFPMGRNTPLNIKRVTGLAKTDISSALCITKWCATTHHIEINLNNSIMELRSFVMESSGWLYFLFHIINKINNSTTAQQLKQHCSGAGISPPLTSRWQPTMRTIGLSTDPSLSKRYKQRLYKADFHFPFTLLTTLKN